MGLTCTIKRLCTLHRHTLHGPGLRKEIRQRPMLRTAIIPERDRVFLPMEANLKLRRFNVLDEKIEQTAGFRTLQFLDAGGENTIDEQSLPPGFRMGTYQRMLGARIVRYRPPDLPVNVLAFREYRSDH